MIKIRRRGDFTRMLDELLVEDESFEQLIDMRIKWFQKNPNDTRLGNHTLTKKMTGKWAFSITDDVRIVYEWLSKTTVRFLAIGGHEQVYKTKDLD